MRSILLEQGVMEGQGVLGERMVKDSTESPAGRKEKM
jgi:hypothetical protein